MWGQRSFVTLVFYKIASSLKIRQVKFISTKINNHQLGGVRAAEISPPTEVEPSKRMQEFRKKLKLDPVPRVSPGTRFVDLMLVKTNPNTGESISDAEKDPTKWGDWQSGGRVSDF